MHKVQAHELKDTHDDNNNNTRRIKHFFKMQSTMFLLVSACMHVLICEWQCRPFVGSMFIIIVVSRELCQVKCQCVSVNFVMSNVFSSVHVMATYHPCGPVVPFHDLFLAPVLRVAQVQIATLYTLFLNKSRVDAYFSCCTGVPP